MQRDPPKLSVRGGKFNTASQGSKEQKSGRPESSNPAALVPLQSVRCSRLPAYLSPCPGLGGGAASPAAPICPWLGVLPQLLLFPLPHPPTPRNCLPAPGCSKGCPHSSPHMPSLLVSDGGRSAPEQRLTHMGLFLVPGPVRMGAGSPLCTPCAFGLNRNRCWEYIFTSTVYFYTRDPPTLAPPFCALPPSRTSM